MKKLFLFTSAVLLSFSLATGANAAELSSDVLTKGTTVTVTNPNKPDTKAPTVSSPKLSTKKLDMSKGKTITLSLKGKDDVSGIDSAYAYFYCKTTGETVSLSYDKAASTKTTIVLKGNVDTAGTYKFSSLSVYDATDNQLYYSSSDSKTPSAFKSLVFTAKAPKSKLSATVDSCKVEGETTIDIDKLPSNYYGVDLDLGMTISNEEATDVVVNFINTKTKEIYGTSAYYNDYSKVYSAYFGATSYHLGTWKVNDIVVIGVSGAKYTIPSSKFPANLKKLKIVYKGKGDTDFPTATKASFKNSKIVMKKNTPGVLDLDITVKDKTTGVKYGYVYFKNAKTGAIYSGSWYYDYNDKPIKSGTISLKINLPVNIASGKYTVYYISVSDGTNYTYYYPSLSGKKSSSTYKYVKLPSSLSKLSFTVKNTYKK